MKLSELDKKWIAIISSEAESLFMETYANALAVFDTPSVVKAVEAFYKLEGFPEAVLEDFNPATICRSMSEVFTTLLGRGALDEFVRIDPTPEAQTELDRMAGIEKQVVDHVAEARASQNADIDECAADFRGRIDSRAFRNKWMTGEPTRRAIYESAIAAGRI
jgi:hypothetical protein